MLQHFAATHNVKLVAVSIGGNNFNFAGIVQTASRTSCSRRRMVAGLLQRRQLGHEQLHVEQRRHAEGGDHERDPERRAGDDERRLLELAVHDPRAGLPVADPERLGLPLLAERLHAPDRPAAAASGTKTPTTPTKRCCRRSTARCSARRPRAGLSNVKTMDLARGVQRAAAVRERRRAARGRGPVAAGKRRSASNKTEWINQIRTITAIFPPYEIQEDLHPNYWGAAGAAQLPDAGLQRAARRRAAPARSPAPA